MSRRLRPGDLVLVHGRGWRARWIRRLTRGPGEPRTWATHVALAVSSTKVIEALWSGVVVRPYSVGRVFRPVNIPPDDLLTIVEHAMRYEGRRYGYWNIAMQAVDGLLGGAYVARRLSSVNGYVECSVHIAAAFAVAGYTFGQDVRGITPDDLADFVLSNPSKWMEIR